jgi:hypothetical protein
MLTSLNQGEGNKKNTNLKIGSLNETKITFLNNEIKSTTINSICENFTEKTSDVI